MDFLGGVKIKSATWQSRTTLPCFAEDSSNYSYHSAMSLSFTQTGIDLARALESWWLFLFIGVIVG